MKTHHKAFLTLTAGFSFILLILGCKTTTPSESNTSSKAAPLSESAAAKPQETPVTPPEPVREPVSSYSPAPVPTPVLAQPEVAPTVVKAPVAETPLAAQAQSVQAAAPAPVLSAEVSTLKPYVPQVVLTQRLRSVGSDTMDVLMLRWEEAFKRHHNTLRIQHEGKGSSTAIPALKDGSADFGPMSRPAKDSEIESFKAQGLQLIQLPVALDALAIYVNPGNPVVKRGLTLAEVDAIFSADRKRNHPVSLQNWGDLGFEGSYATAPIRIYSRNKASGTYAFFREEVLLKGNFKAENFKELASSELVVSTIGRDPAGIGYSGIGYKTDEVLTVPVAQDASSAFIEATSVNALNGSYPLSRFLYLTIIHDPKGPVNHLHREFARFVYSPEAQEIVRTTGYFPVTREIADKTLKSLKF